MRTDYKTLGNYIKLVDTRNRDLAITNLLGVSIEKKFIPSIANIVLYQIKGDVDKAMRETHPELLHSDKTKEKETTL